MQESNWKCKFLFVNEWKINWNCFIRKHFIFVFSSWAIWWRIVWSFSEQFSLQYERKMIVFYVDGSDLKWKFHIWMKSEKYLNSLTFICHRNETSICKRFCFHKQIQHFFQIVCAGGQYVIRTLLHFTLWLLILSKWASKTLEIKFQRSQHWIKLSFEN